MTMPGSSGVELARTALNSERRVLVVSYYYPPFTSAGAIRVSKMTKYLGEYGWTPTVLTVTRDDRPMGMDVEIPPKAIRRVPQLVDVVGLPKRLAGSRNYQRPAAGVGATGTSGILWRLAVAYRHVACFPDPQVGWLVPAVREGFRLIDEIRPHVIFSSSFPNTSHLVAAWLSHRTGIPWIAELRDPWTDNHNFRRVAPLRALEQRLERAVFRQASALVTVSEVWAEALKRRFGKPTYVVSNGYDPLDYPDEAPEGDLFSLVYMGTFYNGKQKPDALFAAVAALKGAGTIAPATFQLRFRGQFLQPLFDAARLAGILPFVTVEGPVSYRESLRLQRNATALLFFDWSDGHEKGCYSAKIYEYLGARRPILSVGPHDSVVADLIAQTGAGEVVETPEEVRLVLERWIHQHRTATLLCETDPASLKPYQRQAAAAAMADILNRHAQI